MWRPWRSRAARSIAPALARSGASSFIEAALCVLERLGRLREALAQLAAEVLRRARVAGAGLDPRRQPQRLRVRLLRHRVHALDVEARALVLAAPVQNLAEVERRR